MNRDPLTQLLYLLMRDHVPTGALEAAMNGVRKAAGMEVTHSAPHLEQYAGKLAAELREIERRATDQPTTDVSPCGCGSYLCSVCAPRLRAADQPPVSQQIQSDCGGCNGVIFYGTFKCAVCETIRTADNQEVKP